MPFNHQLHPLLSAIDTLINDYDSSNPQLVRELRRFRSMLEAELSARDRQAFGNRALQFVTWLKFLKDFFDDN